MQGQHQRIAAQDAGIRTTKPDRFTPLLADIHKGLGNSWSFYEECIEGILADAARQQDPTAWFEQMQQLVEGVEKIQISHEGILFLLQELGICFPKQHSWGEGESGSRKYHSLSLPSEKLQRTSPTSVSNMGLYSVHPPAAMSPIVPFRPLRPSTSALADWPPPRVPTPHLQQQRPLPQPYQQRQKQHQPHVLRDGVLPFDFSASVQPGLTFPSPKDFRNYHCPPDKITMSGDHTHPPPNPLRKTSQDPIFFSDSTLRADVVEAFSFEVQSSRGKLGVVSLQQAPRRLPYDIHEDDLTLWRTLSRAAAESGGSEVKVNGSVTGTWPPWNYRFDLEM